MHVLQVRNVPDMIYERLKNASKVHHRSISGEVIHLLEVALGGNGVAGHTDLLGEISSVREDIAQRYGVAPSSANLIREDRDR
jgi:plasmid stability protein